MNMTKGIWIDWSAIGAQFANEDSLSQREFFRAFLKEIELWPTQHAKESQLISISKDLTPREKELLSCLGAI